MRKGEPRFDFERNVWVGGSPFGDERRTDAPTPGLWSRKAPERVPNRALRRVVAVLTVVPIPLALSLHSWLPAFATIGGLLALREIPRTRVPSMWRVTEADRRLLEDPDDKDVCLVHVTVVRNGETVGEDKGVVWFECGRLLYCGHRTSFAVGGEDVLPVAERYAHVDAYGNPLIGDRTLPLRVPDGWAWVHIVPLADEAREVRFARRFRRFIDDPPPSRGPRQLPPLTP